MDDQIREILETVKLIRQAQIDSRQIQDRAVKSMGRSRLIAFTVLALLGVLLLAYVLSTKK